MALSKLYLSGIEMGGGKHCLCSLRTSKLYLSGIEMSNDPYKLDRIRGSKLYLSGIEMAFYDVKNDLRGQLQIVP